jgi:hypothetical protein
MIQLPVKQDFEGERIVKQGGNGSHSLFALAACIKRPKRRRAVFLYLGNGLRFASQFPGRHAFGAMNEHDICRRLADHHERKARSA